MKRKEKVNFRFANEYFSKKVKKLLVLLFFLFSLLFPFVHPSETLAADFTTSYDITFNFEANGRARVVQKITLKNKTENLYASEYSLTIGSTRVANISATDRLGGVSVTSTKKDQNTVINAKLNDKSVGLGKATTLTVNYTIDDLAVKRGLIWEVNIPKIVTQEEVENYTLSLIAPEGFGELHSIVPTPTGSRTEGTNRVYVFGKGTQNDSISASFGSTQQFKFDLKYRLKNNNVLSAVGTIALPPDTNHQQMVFNTISPEPKRLYVDSDGNYLAEFVVKGRSSQEISVSGYAKVSDQTETIQRVAETSPEQLKKYLVADKYWEVDNASIQKKAKELKNPKEIYNFVSTTLKYNYKRLEQKTPERQGALKALNDPSNSICTDYTDLFIAIARAAGIPARELEGYAYTDNSSTRPIKVGGLPSSNVLHAWPEYYDQDKKRWVAIDPTWGSTTGGVNYFDKLDTNHLVFAIHGSSSVTPVPAGGYKISGTETDDLKVEFAPEPELAKTELIISADFSNVVGGFPSTGKIQVKNPTGRAILTPKISVEIPNAKITSGREHSEVVLLPFQSKTFEVKLTVGDLISSQKKAARVTISGTQAGEVFEQTHNQTVLVKPFFLSINPVSILSLVAFLVLIVLFPPVFNRLKNFLFNRLKLPRPGSLA